MRAASPAVKLSKLPLLLLPKCYRLTLRPDSDNFSTQMTTKSFAFVLVAAVVIATALPAHAKVTKIHITTKESPTFGGYSWPGVGQYEKIVGKAFGELDPRDPKNSVIVDLQLAPRNARGKVEYSFDFYILKPIDLSKGNHKMLYEPPNRGRKTIAALNRGVGGNDPGSVKDVSLLGNSFLMPQGYSDRKSTRLNSSH